MNRCLDVPLLSLQSAPLTTTVSFLFGSDFSSHNLGATAPSESRRSSDTCLVEANRCQRYKYRFRRVNSSRAASLRGTNSSGTPATKNTSAVTTSDIVALMLSDEVSLMTLALKKKRFDAADQVMKVNIY